MLSIFAWWGSKSVIRFWNQSLTTNIVCSFGDNEHGIQFPLITFCNYHFGSMNIILRECMTEYYWQDFIVVLALCLKKNKTFKMSNFMKSIQGNIRDVIKIARLWNGYEYSEHFDHESWSTVFHPFYGLCYTFDLSHFEKFEYITYPKFGIPGLEFVLKENFPWKRFRIIFHTKYDFPDAYQLNGRIDVRPLKYYLWYALILSYCTFT